MRRPIAILVVIGVALAGCGGTGAPGQPAAEDPAADTATDPADTNVGDATANGDTGPVLHVVATVSPVADLVTVVGGDRVSVASLVPPGADSHTYEPRPGDVVRLEEADAYLGVGLGLNDAALELAEATMTDASPVIRLGERALTDTDLIRDHGHDHGHDTNDGNDHAGDHGHDHGDDSGGELEPNPHIWTSLRNAAALVEAIADALSGLDPDGASIYAANAATYGSALTDLDARIAQAVETIPLANRTLVTYHDAWTYFARDYELAYVAAVQPFDYSEPSASEVRAVIDLIDRHEVPALFGSEVFPSGVLDAIAEETGAVYVADLADDVLPGEPGSDEHTYLELMRRNAVLIVEALGGDAVTLG